MHGRIQPFERRGAFDVKHFEPARVQRLHQPTHGRALACGVPAFENDQRGNACLLHLPLQGCQAHVQRLHGFLVFLFR